MQRDYSRLLLSQSAVLEYGEFRKTADRDCTYFRKLLSESSDENTGENGVENFVLNLVLPLSMVGSVIRSSRLTILEDRMTVPSDGRPKGITEFVTGSTGDGLSLPEMFHIVGDKFYIEYSDMDIKLVFEDLIVHPTRKRAFAIPEQGDCAPGYTFLTYNKSIKTMGVTVQSITVQVKDLDPTSFLFDDYYIDRSKLSRILGQRLKMEVKNKDKEKRAFYGKNGYLPNVQFSQHGPAVTVDIADTLQHLKYSKDYVISLPCPKWPKQAGEWLHRRRLWPTMGIVKKVVKDGCHVVLKGSKQRRDNREFLFSFSLCERTISQSLNSCQKRSYILMKFIFKYFIDKVKRGLTTYMCKTVMFWVCENTPASDWTEHNPFESLKWLLEALAGYLRQGYLPNFFIPGNNMIHHISKRSIKACLHDVEKAVEYPWKVILQATESHRFFWLSRDISLIKLLFPVVREDSLARYTMQQATLRFVSSLLDAGELFHAVSMLCGTWAPEFILDTIQYIRRMEQIIESIQDHEVEDCICLKGLLAVLYHQKCQESDEANDYYEFIYEFLSLHTFMDIIDDVGRHIWIIGAYYNLLCMIAEHKQILRHFFGSVYGSKRNERGQLYEPEIYTSVTTINKLTTYPFDLDPHVNYPLNYQAGKTFAVPATAYILFKVIMAYKDLAKETQCMSTKTALRKESRRVFLHLYKWKQQKCTMFPEIQDDDLCYLVGLAAEAVGEFSKRQMLFKEAISNGIMLIDMTVELESDEEIQRQGMEKRDIEQVKLTVHPYTRKGKSEPRKRRSKKKQIEFAFRGGEIPRQSFTHN